MKDAGEERVRHRHQRQHVDFSRHAVGDPEFGEGAGRQRVAFRAAEIRIALDEAKIILLGPGCRDLGIGPDLLERRALAETAAGWCDHDGRRSANTAVASVATSPPPCAQLDAPVLRRAVGLDQADVEIERALRDRRAEIDGERQRIAGALADDRSAPAGWWPRWRRRTGRRRPSSPRWSGPASGCRRRSPAWRRRTGAAPWSACSYFPSLRATGSRERAPDDRLREAIQSGEQVWIASSLRCSQ